VHGRRQPDEQRLETEPRVGVGLNPALNLEGERARLAGKTGEVEKRLVDALFHALETADVDVAVLVVEQAGDVAAARPDHVLHVALRLARHARAIGVDPNLVLTRYAVERFLYRLSRSPYVEQFVLKGALLLLVWLGETLRPTSDADLLGFGDLSDETLMRIMKDVCVLDVEPDAVEFIADSVRVEPIRVGGRLQPNVPIV
jgi:hypothetical protein